MDIDQECIALLTLILRESPQDHQYILCVLARSNKPPDRIRFHTNTGYPTFYGYAIEKIPFYLMGLKILSNLPREGYEKRLITSHYLSSTEVLINKAKTWTLEEKKTLISKFITLNNDTELKEAEVFMIFRDKAESHIRKYVENHFDNISSFLRSKLGRLEFGRELIEKLSQSDIEMSPITTNDDVVERAGITLNTTKGILTYKITQEINPAKQEMLLLKYLMKNKKIIPYLELAKEIKLGCVTPDATNDDVKREVQQKIKILKKILLSIGMTIDSINRTIVVKYKLGYQFSD